MPIVQISVAQGRTPEQLQALMAGVHEAVVQALEAPSASVRVLVTEVSPTLWFSGGVTLADKAATTAR